MPWPKLFILLLFLSPCQIWAAGIKPSVTERQEVLYQFRAYMQALVLGQAAETKKRLACLDYQHQDALNPSGDPELSSLLKEYKASEECQNFLSEGIEKLFLEYSQMRIYLALYQGSPSEVNNLTSSPPAMMGGVRVTPWLCHRLESPLYFFNTNFCFENFRTIANPRPEHILKKSSYDFIDRLYRFYGNRDLPEVTDLPPLTWEEALRATEIFHNHYTEGEDHLAAQRMEELGLDFSDQNMSEDQRAFQRDQRLTKARLNHYYRALDFQAPGVYVFRSYPEESAPARYMEIITRNPVLAFFKPEMTTELRTLDCGDQGLVSRNLGPLCEAYRSSLSSASGGEDLASARFVQSRQSVHKSLIKAYETILKVNQDFQDNFAKDFPLEGLDPEVGDLSAVDDWLGLLAFEGASQAFQKLQTPEQSQIMQELQGEFQSAELWRLGGLMALGIGLSIPCGFVAGPKGLIGCLLATGLTVNGMFYVDSLSRHDNMLSAFFASAHTDPDSEELISLSEFGQLRAEVQALYVDSLFMWVGIGAVPAGKMAAKSFYQKWKSMKNVRSH